MAIQIIAEWNQKSEKQIMVNCSIYFKLFHRRTRTVLSGKEKNYDKQYPIHAKKKESEQQGWPLVEAKMSWSIPSRLLFLYRLYIFAVDYSGQRNIGGIAIINKNG